MRFLPHAQHLRRCEISSQWVVIKFVLFFKSCTQSSNSIPAVFYVRSLSLDLVLSVYSYINNGQNLRILASFASQRNLKYMMYFINTFFLVLSRAAVLLVLALSCITFTNAHHRQELCCSPHTRHLFLSQRPVISKDKYISRNDLK